MNNPNVLFFDNHLLVLEKPANVLTQPDGSGSQSLEEFGKQWLKHKEDKKGNVFLHAVHRLDKPVSGIVLFAKTSKALSRLNESLRNGQFQKTYYALVEGKVESEQGTLEHYLRREEFCSEISTSSDPLAKKCLLHFEVLKSSSSCSLLKVNLITGRYHQIRVQLAAFGHSVVGDLKYGSTKPAKRLFLHHGELSFPHPVQRELLHIKSSVPWTHIS